MSVAGASDLRRELLLFRGAPGRSKLDTQDGVHDHASAHVGPGFSIKLPSATKLLIYLASQRDCPNSAHCANVTSEWADCKGS
jgi:hypothetical protein